MTEQNTAYADHQRIAWKAQVEPGTEVLVDVYPTRQGAESVARGVRSGKFRAYRPSGSFQATAHPAQFGTAVWARYVAGIDAEPLPETMTVRVPDYGTQRGYEGVRVVTVEISARCQMCGGPRGEAKPDPFVCDGEHLVRDAWTNGCGHGDDYAVVLEEARQRADRPRRVKPRDGEIEAVEGGRFAEAVALIVAAREENPWFSAQRAITLLNEAGQYEAAAEVRTFVMTNAGGHSTSANSAALYLVHLDAEARDADTSTSTGDEK